MTVKFFRAWLILLACVAGPIAGGTATAAVTLVHNGQPHAVIVVAGDRPGTVDEAVKELNYWLERISGATLDVMTFDEWRGERPFVAIGQSPLTERAGLDVDELGPEGARVVINGQGVFLIGRDDPPVSSLRWYGSYYAVMELLKNKLNVRQIWPGELGEVFEPADSVRLEPDEWTWETQLTYRRILRNPYRSSAYDRMQGLVETPIPRDTWEQLVDKQSRWLKRQRRNRPSAMQVRHAFGDWWDRFGEDHPDWFSTAPETRSQTGPQNRKLCVSNPEVAEQIFKDWHEAWKENPQQNKMLNAAPNDSRGYCVCSNCRAWDSAEMQEMTDEQIWSSDEAVLSDRYARLWNILADKVAEVDSEAVVGTYAYRSYQQPPQENPVRSNVILGYVGGEGFYPDEPHIREEWAGWAEAGASLFWRPNLLHAGHAAPYVFARSLVEDFHYFHDRNMVGVDFDSVVGAWATQGPTYYVLGELLARPEAEADTLLDEYYDAFGLASDEVRRYFELWDELTHRGPETLRSENLVRAHTWGGWRPGFMQLIPRLYTPPVLEEAERHLDRAEAAVAEEPAVYRDRVDFLRGGLEHTRLMSQTLENWYQYEASKASDDRQAVIASAEALQAYRDKHMGSPAIPGLMLEYYERHYLDLWSLLD